ncbi:MAG: site-specific integrase [Desulfobacteraceae bacterium]
MKKQLRGMDLLSLSLKYCEYAEGRYSSKTYGEKKSVTLRLTEYFGPEFIVTDITPGLADKFLQVRNKERSANSANKDRKNLSAMWNKAKKLKWIPGLEINPWGVVEKFKHEKTPQYTPPLGDVLRVLSVATRKELVFLYSYIYTGARRSEIMRWTWIDDINFEKRKYRLGSRKTKDGSMEYEWFSIPPELYDELWWWWNNRTIKKSPYVFTDDQKGPHYGKRYTTRRRFMKGLCKRANKGIKDKEDKVTPFGFHALRRFFASRMADLGKSTKTIQRFLRHKHLSTTERYIHDINKDMKGMTDGLLEVEDWKKKEDLPENLHVNLTHFSGKSS